MTDPKRVIAINLICTAARDYLNEASVFREAFLLGMLDVAVETHLLSVKEGMNVLKWMKSGNKSDLVMEVEEDNNGISES